MDKVVSKLSLDRIGHHRQGPMFLLWDLTQFVLAGYSRAWGGGMKIADETGATVECCSQERRKAGAVLGGVTLWQVVKASSSRK